MRDFDNQPYFTTRIELGGFPIEDTFHVFYFLVQTRIFSDHNPCGRNLTSQLHFFSRNSERSNTLL